MKKAMTRAEKKAYKLFEKGLIEVSKAAQTFEKVKEILRVEGGNDLTRFNEMLDARAVKAQEALEELMGDL